MSRGRTVRRHRTHCPRGNPGPGSRPPTRGMPCRSGSPCPPRTARRTRRCPRRTSPSGTRRRPYRRRPRCIGRATTSTPRRSGSRGRRHTRRARGIVHPHTGTRRHSRGRRCSRSRRRIRPRTPRPRSLRRWYTPGSQRIRRLHSASPLGSRVRLRNRARCQRRRCVRHCARRPRCVRRLGRNRPRLAAPRRRPTARHRRRRSAGRGSVHRRIDRRSRSHRLSRIARGGRSCRTMRA